MTTFTPVTGERVAVGYDPSGLVGALPKTETDQLEAFDKPIIAGHKGVLRSSPNIAR